MLTKSIAANQNSKEPLKQGLRFPFFSLQRSAFARFTIFPVCGLIVLSGCSLFESKKKSARSGANSAIIQGEIALDRTPSGTAILIQFDTLFPAECMIHLRENTDGSQEQPTTACTAEQERSTFKELIENLSSSKTYTVTIKVWPRSQPEKTETFVINESLRELSDSPIYARIDLPLRAAEIGRLQDTSIQRFAEIFEERYADDGCKDSAPDLPNHLKYAQLGMDRLVVRGYGSGSARSRSQRSETLFVEFGFLQAAERLTWFYRFLGNHSELISAPPELFTKLSVSSNGNSMDLGQRQPWSQPSTVETNRSSPIVFEWDQPSQATHSNLSVLIQHADKEWECISPKNSKRLSINVADLVRDSSTKALDLYIELSSLETRISSTKGVPPWVIVTTDWRHANLNVVNL